VKIGELGGRVAVKTKEQKEMRDINDYQRKDKERSEF